MILPVYLRYLWLYAHLYTDVMATFQERFTLANVRPPGPRGVPLLGMLPALRRDPIAVFTDAARRFGDIAYLKPGPLHGVLITRPDDVRHVLQDHARNYHKSPLYEKLRSATAC